MDIFYKLTLKNIKPHSFLIIRVVLLFVFLSIILPISAIYAGNAYSSRINEKASKKWLSETIREIKNFGPEKCFNKLEPTITEVEGFYQQSYRLNESGCIFFENGDWIYLVSNSSHNNSGVGDITLAMDNHNRFFKNEGHVCGGIIHFMTNQRTEIKSARQFFELFVSDTDSKAWQKL
ncbi:MAG: hypothetical protein K0B15_12205 [Lentimicrobium sp.]|nr:hypothetical protein [Lentimicrobium sp.]